MAQKGELTVEAAGLRVHLLVLNYNGRPLLEKYLPSILEAAQRSRHVCKVSVIDNQSSDDSVSFLRSHFPSVRVFVAPENRVLCSFNEVVQTLTEEIVVFLNNDMRLDPRFVDPLVSHFAHPDLLFVAPKECSLEGSFRGGLNRGAFEWGFFKNTVRNGTPDRLQHTLSVHGGAFDRAKWLALGGYDDLYLPGYVEDLDLCYRGWKRGWKGLYEPRSVMFHEGGASFNAVYGRPRTLALIHRNVFLFFWKNITSPWQIFLHLFLLLPRLGFCLLTGRWSFVHGFFLALCRLSKALQRRRLVKGTFLLRDEEALQQAAGKLECL